MGKIKVGLGMSGGVDSSVAAYLLKQQGFDVIGITMWLVDDEKASNSIADAASVCKHLGIEHHVIDLREKFKNIVIKDFIECYKRGVTPNPCCLCNRFFKFGLFYEEAIKFGCSLISTGHYATVCEGMLFQSNVLEKDQSYFLWGIDKNILKKVILPLQDYDNKELVRDLAKKAGINVSDKKDSQEVCFVPNDDYKAFLDDNLEVAIGGEILLLDGTVIGKHNGLRNYTIGQRKGLNISYSEPLYVISLDPVNNRLIVGTNEDLFKNKIIAGNINLIVDELPDKTFAKVRSRGMLRPCLVRLDNEKMFVELLENERAITPGQSIVLYDENGRLLGGGIIEEAL